MSESILTSNVTDIQPRIVRRELNLDFGQFFYPQGTRKVFVTRLFRSELADEDGNRKTIKAKVSYHPDYGTLTTTDERVFYVLVEFWQEQGKPETVYFSEREIARRLNVNWCGSTSTIFESLTRLRGVLIEWDGSFFHKPSERLVSIKNPFTILSYLKTVSTKDGGIKQQLAELSFDKRIVQNLESKYSRPILLDTVLSFHSPLAQALYTYLEPRLFGTNHFNRTTKGLFIDDLGLIGSSYQRKANRVQYIKRAKQELIGKRFYYDEAITKVEVANGSQDAIFHAHRSGTSKLKGQVIEIPYQPAASKEPKTKKPQNRRRASLTPKVGDNTTYSPKTPPRASQEAYELLECFANTFNHQGKPKKTRNAVLKAQEIINQHGMERAKFFIQFAHREATKTNYQPKHLQGIIKYLDAAIAEYERLQRIAKKGEDDVARRRLENARYDHERTYESDYHQFIDQLLLGIDDQHLEKFNTYRTWQLEERNKIATSLVAKGIKEIQLRTFDSEGAGILRLQQFFKDDPDINIPTFWEWDTTHNPHSFGTKPSR